MSQSYKEASRILWMPTGEIVREDINTGCLQRIADALEAMAKPYTNLLERAAWLEKERTQLYGRVKTLLRSRTALRACLRKAKSAPKKP